MNKRIMPSYPLFVKDPYFSIWAADEILNKEDTVFWTGQKSPVLGLVSADSKLFSFMGVMKNAERLIQKELTVGTFNTQYKFECDLFDLEVDFISPLPPNNLEILSSPVCYFSYKVIPHKELESLRIMLIFKQEVVCEDKDMRGGTMHIKNKKTAWFGLAKQQPLSHVGDEVKAEWGYYYLAADNAYYLTTEQIYKHLQIPLRLDDPKDNKNILAFDEYNKINKSIEGTIAVAMDDTVSINYFGEWLRGYYFRNGRTIFDALNESFENYYEILRVLKEIESDLICRTTRYKEEYLKILNASFRQVMAAHKLVENKDKELLFLSKECSSNGCIATTDVSYPSYPMFLLYNADLARAMLTPIFTFARKEVWDYDFAPHDVGTYPYCCGQTYSLDNKSSMNGIQMEWEKKQTFPPIYAYPKGSKVYNDDRQMPVEESGNMIIMAYAAAAIDGNLKQLVKNFDLLEKWANYLIDKGMFPENQLCTDDFGGHIKGNINLSAKTIVALKAFSRICRMLNKGNKARKYKEIATEFANIWRKSAWSKNKTHTKLSYDSDDSTYSLKYNIAYDILMDTKLFDKGSLIQEFNYYLTKLNEYGIPLDSRNTYTKSDWLIWVCLFTEDYKQRGKIIKTVQRFLENTADRVPFSDWYDTINGRQKEFKNRTVQGGLFILLLHDEKALLYGGVDA